MKREIPGPLWVAIFSLGLMILGKFIAMFAVGPAILIDAVLSGILLYGIIKGHKWAYIFTFIAVVIGTLIGLSNGVQSAVAVLVLDCLVLVPVLMCTSYFYPTGLADA